MTRPPSHEAPSSPHPLGSLKHQGTSLPSGNLRGSAAVPAWSKQQPLLRHVSRSAPGGPMQSTLSASGVDGEQPAEPVTFTWEFMAEPSANPGPAVVFTVTPASPLSEKARTRSARPSSDMDIGSAVSMNHRGRSSPPDSGAAIVLQRFFNKILARLNCVMASLSLQKRHNVAILGGH